MMGCTKRMLAKFFLKDNYNFNKNKQTKLLMAFKKIITQIYFE